MGFVGKCEVIFYIWWPLVENFLYTYNMYIVPSRRAGRVPDDPGRKIEGGCKTRLLISCTECMYVCVAEWFTK